MSDFWSLKRRVRGLETRAGSADRDAKVEAGRLLARLIHHTPEAGGRIAGVEEVPPVTESEWQRFKQILQSLRGFK